MNGSRAPRPDETLHPELARASHQSPRHQLGLPRVDPERAAMGLVRFEAPSLRLGGKHVSECRGTLIPHRTTLLRVE
eukprot:1863108-Pyramimonas_sp.AAC.1